MISPVFSILEGTSHPSLKLKSSCSSNQEDGIEYGMRLGIIFVPKVMLAATAFKDIRGLKNA